MGSTLAEALADSIGEAVPPEDGGEPGPPPGGTVDEQIAALLQEAEDHFAAAEDALRAGDLATYQAETEAARSALEEALSLIGAQAGPSPSPSPSPSG
jgi:hypothetical protein